MKRKPSVREHLDTEAILDYLEDRGDLARRQAVEDHLATPCTVCRDRLHEIGLLVGRMREDRVPNVPARLRELAISSFQPVRRPASTSARGSLARLLFDSWAQPAAAVTRRTVGEARRLRLALGDHAVELEFEREGPDEISIRGRLEVPDPALYEIVVAAGSERRAATADTDGVFLVQRVPGNRLVITVIGPTGRYRIPEVTL